MKFVLIIDDNSYIRENTAEILELAGYKTFTAENGKKGLEIAFKEKPDIIICDITMPELDGFGVLHSIQKNPATQNIPFIFLTARTEKADFRKGMEMGAVDFVTKPFEEIELLNTVEIRLQKAEFFKQKDIPATGFNDFAKNIEDKDVITRLTQQYEAETMQKKQLLYRKGKRPKFLYYLVKGKVKEFKINEDGKEYITNVFSDGDFIGYQALVEEKEYNDSAMVLEEAEVIQIPKDEFLQMIHKDMTIAAKFIRAITKNINERDEQLLTMAYDSLRKRVAKALVYFHIKYNKDAGNNPIGISRDNIAHYIGTATESLIRTLRDFKNEKLIDITGTKIQVIQLGKLKELRH